MEELRVAPWLSFFGRHVALGVFVRPFAYRSFQVFDRWVLKVLPGPDTSWSLLPS